MKKYLVGATLVAIIAVAVAWLYQNPEPIFIGKAPNGIAVCAWTYIDGTTAWLSESDFQQSPWKNREHLNVTAETWEQAAAWLKSAKSYKKAWVKSLYDYDYSSYEYSYVYDTSPSKK